MLETLFVITAEIFPWGVWLAPVLTIVALLLRDKPVHSAVAAVCALVLSLFGFPAAFFVTLIASIGDGGTLILHPMAALIAVVAAVLVFVNARLIKKAIRATRGVRPPPLPPPPAEDADE